MTRINIYQYSMISLRPIRHHTNLFKMMPWYEPSPFLRIFWLLWIFHYYILVMKILGNLLSTTLCWQNRRHQNWRGKEQWYLHSLINKHWKWVYKCEVLCVELVGLCVNSSIIALNYILNSFHTCVMHMCHLNLNLVFWSEGRISDNLVLLTML
jgi:hypothetical protein